MGLPQTLLVDLLSVPITFVDVPFVAFSFAPEYERSITTLLWLLQRPLRKPPLYLPSSLHLQQLVLPLLPLQVLPLLQFLGVLPANSNLGLHAPLGLGLRAQWGFMS